MPTLPDEERQTLREMFDRHPGFQTLPETDSFGGSIAPVLTVPAEPTTAIGTTPRSVSLSMACSSCAGIMRKELSTGISRKLSRPIPSSAIALGIDI